MVDPVGYELQTLNIVMVALNILNAYAHSIL